MNHTMRVGEENIYFETEMKSETCAGVYENILSEASVSPIKQTTFEKPGSEKKRAAKQPTRNRHTQPDPAVVRRLLCIIIAVVSVFFLIAAATLILAVMVLMFHSAKTSSGDFSSVQAELEEMKKNFSRMNSDSKEKIRALFQEIEKSREERNKLNEKYNITALWQKTHTNKEEVKHIVQKENVTVLWQAVQTNKKNIQQLRQQKNMTVLWQLVQTNRINIKQLRQQVMNISTIPGPRGSAGLPGHNGTQGPPGVAGPPGSFGPPGSGNLSLCTYKQAISSPFAKGKLARISVTATEQKGQKFLGVNCDTNDASVVELTSTPLSNGLLEYKCNCKGTVDSGDPKMHCVIHYWECSV